MSAAGLNAWIIVVIAAMTAIFVLGLVALILLKKQPGDRIIVQLPRVRVEIVSGDVSTSPSEEGPPSA